MPLFDPPDHVPTKTSYSWMHTASASFKNPKLLRSRYWKRYNTIEIPLLPADDFYKDALAAARESNCRDEVEQLLEAKYKERREELERLIIEIGRKGIASDSMNLDRAARDMWGNTSLATLLSLITSFLWPEPDNSKAEMEARLRQRWAEGESDYDTSEQAFSEMGVGECEDEDDGKDRDDDRYMVRECPDSPERANGGGCARVRLETPNLHTSRSPDIGRKALEEHDTNRPHSATSSRKTSPSLPSTASVHGDAEDPKSSPDTEENSIEPTTPESPTAAQSSAYIAACSAVKSQEPTAAQPNAPIAACSAMKSQEPTAAQPNAPIAAYSTMQSQDLGTAATDFPMPNTNKKRRRDELQGDETPELSNGQESCCRQKRRK